PSVRSTGAYRIARERVLRRRPAARRRLRPRRGDGAGIGAAAGEERPCTGEQAALEEQAAHAPGEQARQAGVVGPGEAIDLRHPPSAHVVLEVAGAAAAIRRRLRLRRADREKMEVLAAVVGVAAEVDEALGRE